VRGQPAEEKRSNIPAPASRAVKTAVLRTGSEVPEVQRRNDSWGGADRAPIKVRKQERGKGKERKGKERKGKERKGVIAAKNSYEENGSAHGRGDPVDAAARGRRRLKRPAGCADSLPAGTAAPGCDVSGTGRGLWVCKGSRVRQSPRSPQNSIGSATPDKSCGQRHPYGIRDA